MKKKFKNYGFWVSLASATVIFLQAIGLRVNTPIVNEIVSAILGVLVVLGIVSNPSQGSGFKDE